MMRLRRTRASHGCNSPLLTSWIHSERTTHRRRRAAALALIDASTPLRGRVGRRGAASAVFAAVGQRPRGSRLSGTTTPRHCRGRKNIPRAQACGPGRAQTIAVPSLFQPHVAVSLTHPRAGQGAPRFFPTDGGGSWHCDDRAANTSSGLRESEWSRRFSVAGQISPQICHFSVPDPCR